jgi:hypothetical protein
MGNSTHESIALLLEVIAKRLEQNPNPVELAEIVLMLREGARDMRRP